MGKQKFYAVRVGRKPGVYYTWDECKKQVDGYTRAEYKSFGTLAEAQTFVGAPNAPVASAPANTAKRGGAGGSGVYYAIAAGWETGIFSCKWAEIQHLVKHYPNAQYERFTTLEAAEEYMADFIQNNVDHYAPEIGNGGSKRYKSTYYEAPAPPPAFVSQQTVHQPAVQPAVQQQSVRHAASVPSNKRHHDSVVIYFDGGSRKNPGRAGYGFVIYDSSLQHKLRMGCRPLKYGSSNNQAEYTGMLEGIRYAVKEFGAKQLLIRGDSELVMKQMRGVYRVASELLIPLYNEARQLLEDCSDVRFEHVYREQNREADQLSNLAMDTDQAVEDIVKMWRQGNTNRASYVDVLVRMAEVDGDNIAVESLRQCPSFLQAAAALLAMLWDLPQQQVQDMLQERGWTEGIGGPPIAVHHTAAAEGASAANGVPDNAAATAAAVPGGSVGASGRGMQTVAVAAVTLGDRWGREIRRQEDIMQQQRQPQQQQLHVGGMHRSATAGEGSNGSGGGGGGVSSKNQMQQRWQLQQQSVHRENMSTAVPAASVVVLSGNHADRQPSVHTRSQQDSGSLPRLQGNSGGCHGDALWFVPRSQQQRLRPHIVSSQHLHSELHIMSSASSSSSTQCSCMRSRSRCRLAGVVASAALCALRGGGLGRRIAGRGVQGFGSGRRHRMMRLPAA